MSALTDAIRAHFVKCVNSGRFDGEGLDKLLEVVESVQYRAAYASRPAANEAPSDAGLESTDCSGILKGNADLEQPEHDAHVRAMEAREAVRRG